MVRYATTDEVRSLLVAAMLATPKEHEHRWYTYRSADGRPVFTLCDICGEDEADERARVVLASRSCPRSMQQEQVSSSVLDDIEREEDELEYDIGTCQTCGGYGRLGRTCSSSPACREYGSEYM